MTRLLSDLVAIPSVNPMGRGLSGSEFLEGGVSDYLEGWFAGLKVDFERQVVSPGRDNLIARYDAPSSRRTILFDAHQDTVPVDGMTIAPFSPELREGRLYGRGACDIKGGMAAMLTAFARLVRERPAGSASVVMACTVDEEFTHTGSSKLASTNLGADLAIVAEPTLLNIVDRHKGAVRWKIRTKGVACHSSTPELGENAIYKMAGVIRALADYAGALGRSTPDPVLGPPSLSVGRIEGGTSVNVVPDWCEIDIDRRVIPGERPLDCIGRVRSFLTEQLGELSGIEFLPPWVTMPPLIPGRAESSLPALKRAIERIGGRTPDVMGVPYGTDGGPLGDSGLPCVVFGPGDIAQAHTKDEWVELEQVRMASEIYFEMARELGSAG
ncbi:M20 family metallopeptidase [Tundrisphaera lichenicola]|uniref:M20 family metallopeptidase n=1 Tax=Tundrisphaera lichenicola TaxID=2029860 RepID=UPI003EB7FBA8